MTLPAPNQMKLNPNHPLWPVYNALSTSLGRFICLVGTFVFGMAIGPAIAERSIRGLIIGIACIPHFILFGFISGLGLILLPAALLFGYLFIRYEWPLRVVFLLGLPVAYYSYYNYNIIINK